MEDTLIMATGLFSIITITVYIYSQSILLSGLCFIVFALLVVSQPSWLQTPKRLPKKTMPSADSSTQETKKKVGSGQTDPYIHELEPLSKKLLGFADLDAEPASDQPDALWSNVISQTNANYTCHVQKRNGQEFFFRIVVDFESTPEETFDIIADISKRSEWDEVTESSGVIQQISNKTSIQFLRTRGIWPAAPRISLVLAFLSKLPDGRYINVTRSIESHPDFVEPEGDVRMIAHIAGLVVGPHPSGNPNLCRCVQVVDGDLGGWLPKSIVSMVTTQAFPISMRRVNKMLRKVETPRTVSKLISAAESTEAVKAEAAPSQVIKAPAAAVKAKASLFQKIYKLVEKSQPWLILIIFILQFWRRQ